MLMRVTTKILILGLIISPLLAQNLFVDPNEATTKQLFNDPNKKTSDTSQAVYDEGGESTFNRITEAEKAIDFLKKEIASLKAEISALKSNMNEVSKNTNKETSSTKANLPSVNYETPSTKPKSKPTPY
jgi:hypothetical protein